MASSQVVLLLVAVYVCVTTAQYSPFGNFGQQSFGGGPSYGSSGLLTCIGTNEALDHLKITIRPEPRGQSSSPAFNYGNPLATSRELSRRDWRISAVYIPASSLGVISPAGTSSLVGQFFLAVTRNGRTDGGCAGLGGVLQDEDRIRTSRQPRFPGGFPGGQIPGSNPFFGGNPYLRPPFPGAQQPGFPQQGFNPFGQPQQNPFGDQFNQFGGGRPRRPRTPAGFIQDPIVISQGGNVYSGVIRDLSEIDLRGRGIAVCLDYLCSRPTTTCCSIVKDQTPATETVGTISTGPATGYNLNNPTFQGGNLQGGNLQGGNLAGGALPGGNIGGTGGAGGLF